MTARRLLLFVCVVAVVSVPSWALLATGTTPAQQRPPLAVMTAAAPARARPTLSPAATVSAPSTRHGTREESTPPSTAAGQPVGEVERCLEDDASARIEALGRAVEQAIAARRGERLLELLAELAPLGMDGWPLASRLLVLLDRSIRDGNWLGVDEYEFRRVARSGTLAELLVFALDDPAADPALRRLAVRELPWTEHGDVVDHFLGQLGIEQDPAIAKQIATSLTRRPNPSHVDELVSSLATQKDRQTRAIIVEALGTVPGDDASRALTEIACREADPDVRRMAELMLVARAAPVEGYLVTRTAAREARSEVVAGDIVIAVDGTPISSRERLEQAVGGERAETPVSVTVYRQGSVLTFTVPGSRLGVEGRFVRPPGAAGQH